MEQLNLTLNVLLRRRLIRGVICPPPPPDRIFKDYFCKYSFCVKYLTLPLKMYLLKTSYYIWLGHTVVDLLQEIYSAVV